MKRYFFFLTSLIVIALSACDNNTIGSVIQPADDKLKVVSDSFILSAHNEMLKGRYSETDKLVLGVIKDPVYGSFRLNQVISFRNNLRPVPASATNGSLKLIMYYHNFIGDAHAPQEASVYALNQKLDFEKAYTADFDIHQICDFQELMGRKSFTAMDVTVSDSVRHTENYCDSVMITMPDKYLNELMTNHKVVASQENFEEFLKGVYITNTFGEGTVLNVDSVNLQLDFLFAPNANKPDSIVPGRRLYPANREVTQFINVSEIQEPQAGLNNDSLLYLVSSSGCAIRVEFPKERILERLTRDNPNIQELNINHASIQIDESRVFHRKDSVLIPPPFVILVRAEDMEQFFTQSLYPSMKYPTVLGAFDYKKRCYTTNNMSGLLEAIIKGELDTKDKTNSFYLVPVSGTKDVEGTNAVIRHEYKPCGVRLCGSDHPTKPIRLAITYTVL